VSGALCIASPTASCEASSHPTLFFIPGSSSVAQPTQEPRNRRFRLTGGVLQSSSRGDVA
jgi:hypothetical protein